MIKSGMKTILFAIVVLVAALPVYASEIEGTLSAGAGATGGLTLTVDPQVNGTVVSRGVPTASPVAGTYTSAQSVALSAPSDALSIRYSLLSTDPTCSTGTLYSTPISVTSTTGIRAIACYAGDIASNVASFAYVISAPTPPAPSGGGSGGGGGGAGGFITTAPLRGDINNDNKVDFFDFSALLVDWGKTNPSTFTNPRSDLNGDGRVDFADFTLLLVYWTV